MKRKHKGYSRPKRPYDKVRIEEEKIIKEEFGLKNKKEIWKAEARVKAMREKAKNLISASPEKQKALFNTLKKIGLNINSIGDILSLTKTDYLKRRLQTVVVNKKIANTSKQARQFIVHKKILVDGKAVNSPAYIVPTDLENKITLKLTNKKPKEKKVEEIKQEENAEESLEEENA